MRGLVILALWASLMLGDWVMYGDKTVFIYNPKTGEVYRYFEQDGNVGFMKLNYHKNFVLKSTPNSNQSTTSGVSTDKLTTDLLKDTILKNSLNGLLE